MVVNLFSDHKISVIHNFFTQLCLLFYKLLKIFIIVLVKKNFKKLAFQSLPLHSKKFFRTLNYIVINVFYKFKLSDLHDFSS